MAKTSQFDRWDRWARDLILWTVGLALIVNEALIQRIKLPADEYNPSYFVAALGFGLLGLPFALITGETMRNKKADPEEENADA